jgi:hypothetical protein
MKIENLIFSLIVVFVAVVAISILGWGFSFFVAQEIELKDAVSGGDAYLFLARVFIGLSVMGIMNGLYKLWCLFVFIMKEAPVK